MFQKKTLTTYSNFFIASKRVLNELHAHNELLRTYYTIYLQTHELNRESKHAHSKKKQQLPFSFLTFLLTMNQIYFETK
jgi:hypothetical protein